FWVETPLFVGMLVEQQVAKEGDAEVHDEEVNAGDTAKRDVITAHGEVPTADEEPSIPSPTPPTPPPQPSQDILSTSQVNAGDTAKRDVITAHGEVPTADEEPSIPSPTPPTPPPQPSHDIPSTSWAKEDPAVKRYQVLKRKLQTKAQARKNMIVYLKNVDGFKMDYFKGMSYDDICPIFEAKFNINVAFLLKTKDQIEQEESRALKRINETPAKKATKRQKEELEALWSLVKERFSTTKPKNFFDNSLLIILGVMFEKPDIHAQIWKNQRSVHGLAKNNQRSVHGPVKVKGWKLLESCGVQIITFTTTQLILLVKRKYPLTRFTLDQMLNAVRLEVKEESEVSLELLRFIRQKHQEGG
nr:hypothetical protein [Tanacetum cinerariifolium]